MKLETLWVRLCEGSARIVSHGSSEQAFRLVVNVDPSIDPDGNYPEPRPWAILHALLLGTSRMAIALERAVTQSTVTWASSHALRACGATRELRTVPVVLAAAAHAAAGVTNLDQIAGTNSVVDRRGITFLLPRVESAVRGRLGAVEFTAIQHCLQGHTTVHAAAQTQMSPQAISAGRARAFRKIGVGGRLELISYLLRAQYGVGLRGAAFDMPSHDRAVPPMRLSRP